MSDPVYGTFEPTTRDAFQKWGHQGRFHKSWEVNKSGSLPELYCTSSVLGTYGVGGIITTTGAVGTASLSDGGVVKLEDLAVGQIHELSLAYVKEDAANSVYVLVKNPRVR